AIHSSLSNRSPSTIDISSMTSTLVRSHRFLAFTFFRILLISSTAGSFPSPIPAKLWRVTPPMLQAARPVEAVMATA
ncbi:hypothetical protein HOY80DRAFT_860686, partial [Tuber brumale]